MKKKIINEREFSCPRPNRIVSQLEFEITGPGFELCLLNVFDINNPSVMLYENAIWFSDLPEIPQIADDILDAPEKFLSIARKRRSDFKTIVEELSKLNKEKLTISYLWTHTNQLIELLRLFLKYVHLAIADGYILDMFRNFLVSFTDPPVANSYLHSLIVPPTYVRNMINANVMFREDKSFHIPPVDPRVIVTGKIVEVFSHLDDDIFRDILSKVSKEHTGDLIKFATLRTIAPLIYQLGEENHYIGKAIIVHLEYALTEMAKILMEKGLITRLDEILNYDLVTLEHLFQNFEQ